MTELSKTERRAIEAVANHFSASWERGDDPPGAFLTLAGRKIALAIATVPGQGPSVKSHAKARFRDDKVARRFLSDLEAAVGARTSDGRTVILTLGAPIKLPNQTLVALTEMVFDRLASGAVDVEEQRDILGNRVRFLVLSDGSAWTSKAVGFVFSGDPGPGDLAKAMRALQEAIIAKAATSLPDRMAGDGWLVLAGGDWIADIKTYRRAFSRLSVPDRFEKILMVFDGGRIEALTD